MRQLHLNEKESGQNGTYASVSLAAEQQAGLIPTRELLVDIEQAQPTTDALMQRCSRDNPALELLNLLTYFSSAALVMLLPYFISSKEGAASVLTISTLIGMNYGMRRAIKRGYAKDAELFAELGPETVDKLIDYIGSPNARIEAVASQVLAQLLQSFTRDQFDVLPPAQRTRLYAWLRNGSSSCAEAKISVLRWLADVADSEAVGYIEQVAKRIPITPTQRRLRKEARIVLALVLERIDKENAAEDANLSAKSEAAVRSIEDDDLETTEESRALLAQIRKHSANRRAPGMRMGFLIANWCFITPYFAFNVWDSFAMHRTIVERAAWLAGTVLSSQLYRLALTPTHTRMARQLANSGDTHAVGALAEALEWPDEEIKRFRR
jgi:hypothetical protein